MLQHVEQYDQVIMPVFQRHLGQIAALHLDARAIGRESACMVVRFDRVDRAELLQHRDVGAGTAADLENSQWSRLRPPAFEQCGQDPAAADEPPMVAVDFRHPVVDMAFHQASSSPAPPILSRTM